MGPTVSVPPKSDRSLNSHTTVQRDGCVDLFVYEESYTQLAGRKLTRAGVSPTPEVSGHHFSKTLGIPYSFLVEGP